jgi:signal transduction histidine kinase
LTLAVLNLVDNAIKYAASGGVVMVSVHAAFSELVLEVRDRGPGIHTDEREQVFERFYRSRDVRLKPIRGSGIGLALVHHIAVAHGGSVEVVDNEPDGCCFRMRIPAADV